MQQSRYVVNRALEWEVSEADGRIKKAIALARTRVNGVEDASNPQPFFLDGATTAYCRAYYPAMNPIVPALWTVEQDQSTLDGVRKSDLMFAEGTTDASLSGAATPTTSIVLAPFRHRMARLRITLTPMTTSKVKRIDIVGGAYRQVNILDTEKLITGNDLQMPCTEAAPLLICPVATTATTYNSYMDYAVLLPAQTLCQQTAIGERKQFLKITLWNNTAITVEMAPKNIVAGKTYTMNLGQILDVMVGKTISLGSWNETQRLDYQYATSSSLDQSSKGLYQINNSTFRMLDVEPGSTVGKYTADATKGVDLSTHKKYYLAETEATQAVWKEAMGDLSTSLDYAPSQFGDDLPIYGYNWKKLREFFQRLNAMTGSGTVNLSEFGVTITGSNKRPADYYFTLPTENEWRYAAQGGVNSKGYLYSGGDDLGRVGWYSDNSGNSAQPVAMLRANELGFYDMSGNYWELNADYRFDTSSGNYNRKGIGGVMRTPSSDLTPLKPFLCSQLGTAFGPTANAAWSGHDLGFRIALVHKDDMQDCQKFAIPNDTTHP